MATDNGSRWREVSRIYGAALQRAPADREAYVSAACGADASLRRDVESLLAQENEPVLIDRPAFALTAALPSQMSVQIGSQIGVYRIDALIGVGGMGEVYRARDTKLNRDVAIKILPAAFASDPDRLARFKREAQVLASLNHPHIAQIYGFEDSSEMHALVMELVEGPTLADRIARGALPVADALAIARQIADALEAAHEAGIVHRDLKPANIKVREDGTVKVLDFGLAKISDPAPAAGPTGAGILTQSPTVTTPAMTAAGIILGTAAYMSPEQARGKPVDRKTDIWAFGCVLYETLTGRQAFDGGETVSDAIAAILKNDVDWNALPPETPASIVWLLHRCLQKDPQRRLPHIGVARLELNEPEPSPLPRQTNPTKPTSRTTFVFVSLLAALATAALSAAAVWTWKPSAPRTVVRFSFAVPEGRILGSSVRQELTVSRDGTQVAFEAGRNLFVHSVVDGSTRAVSGVNNLGAISNPVFSPDGQWLAFHAPGTIQKVAVAGGTPVTLCETNRTTSPYGMSWDATGIVFDDANRGIVRVSPNGGDPQVLVPARGGELVHAPQLLPDGETLLFSVATAISVTNAHWQIVAQSLRTGTRHVLVADGSEARYVPSGHLLYASRGVLFAAPFNVRSLSLTGAAIPVLEGIRTDVSTAQIAVSAAGTLAYIPGIVTGSFEQTELALFDRAGKVERLKIPAGAYETPRVSPDGRYIAFGSDDGKNQSIWVYELSGASAMRRLTFAGKSRFPVWAPDSRRIAYQSDAEHDRAIFVQLTDGTGMPERVTTPQPGVEHVADSWSPDGTHLLFDAVKGVDTSLWILSLRDRQVTSFPAAPSKNPYNATFSPDGKWVAYQSIETGNMQLFVQPFPATGTKYQLTRTLTQSHYPAWTRDGKEILFVPGRGLFASLAVAPGMPFTVSRTTELARGSFYEGGPSFVRSYDLARDGRILAPAPAGFSQSGPEAPPRIEVIVNWLDELIQRVPVR